MSIKADGTLTISFSEIQTYLSCPFKHKLNYLSGEISREVSPALAYGNALHKGVQALWELGSVQECVNLFEQELTKEFLPIAVKDTYKEYLNSGKNFIPLFSKDKLFKDYKLVKCEYVLKERIGTSNMYYTGFIDALLVDKNGKYLVVDFKTTNKGWNNIKRSDKVTKLQLLLYKYFLSKKEGLKEDDIQCKFILFTGADGSIEHYSPKIEAGEARLAYKTLINVAKSIYIQKKNNYKNTSSCFICRWNNNIFECDKMNRSANFIDVNSLIES